MLRFISIVILFCIPVLANGSNFSVSIDSLMMSGIRAKYYPGASILIGSKDAIIHQACYGSHDYNSESPVIETDLFDLASCTKIIATTFAVMRLYDQDKIGLYKKVEDYLSEYRFTAAGKVTIKELLTHSSGFTQQSIYSMISRNSEGGALISGTMNDIYVHQVDKNSYLCRQREFDQQYLSVVPGEGYRQAGRNIYINSEFDKVITHAIINSYRADRRGRYLYCDTNFHILKLIIEHITGETLDRFAGKLFDELDMKNTGYCPLNWKSEDQIMPTEDDILLGRGVLRGYVHDDLAAASGCVGGNAGLFSDAADLSHFCMMMLHGGEYEGIRILKYSTVKLFTSTQFSYNKVRRGLGFDKRNETSVFFNGYGHTGYTGTMVWIDPVNDRYMVLLSNRVYPSRLNDGLAKSMLRETIWKEIRKGGY